MKIQISLFMDVLDYMTQAQEARTLIDNALHALFDMHYYIRVEIPDTGESVGYLWVFLSNVAGRCSQQQHENASLKLRFKMRLTDMAGVQSDLNSLNSNWRMSPVKL